MNEEKGNELASFYIWAATHLIIAATSKIPGAVFQLFQWIIFAPIAIISWLGA